MMKLMAAALLASVGLAAVAAQAQTAERSQDRRVTRSIPVTVADLDLAHPAGAEAALARIDRAASRACGGRANNRFVRDRQLYLACVRAATSRAVADLDAPLVTALHEGRAAPGYDLASAAE